MRANSAIRHWILLLVCSLAWWAGNAVASDKVLDVGTVGQQPVALTEYFSVLEDPGATLTLADVRSPEVAARFKGDQAPTTALNYGFTRSAYWLRLTLRNNTDRPVDRLLEISFVRLGDIQFHQLDQSGNVQSVHTGFMQAFATRPYENRFFVFPTTLAAQSEQTYLLRVRSNASLQIPARLWTTPAFHEHEVKDYLRQAWYFGMVTAMVLFNVILFVALRDTLYLLYVLFVGFFSLGTFAESGLGNQFLWAGAPAWTEPSGLGLYALALLFFVPFMRRMLNTPSTLPKSDRILQLYWVAYLVLLFGLFIDYSSFVKPFNLVTLTGIVAQIGISLVGTLKRQRSAYFFLAAFGALGLAGGLNGLRSLGLLVLAIPASNLVQLGSALEMMVLAFALADRYNTLRQDKAAAQALAIQAQAETLQAQAQTQLAQTEKITTLMQLVTNVAHEVNTPIGAVKASGKNIAVALDDALGAMPKLFSLLDPPARALFIELISLAGRPSARLTTREERVIKNAVRAQLEAAGLEGSDRKARILVRLHAQSGPLYYLPLLQHAESDFILEAASSFGTIINGTATINTAVDRVAKIVTTLKSFSQIDTVGAMQAVDLRADIETVLGIYANQIKQGTELVRQYETLPTLQGLPDELIEVWTHLIHNALQAMGNQGRLTIHIGQVGDEAVVSLSDTGTGIPDSIRDRIFEPFFTTRPPGEGAGLGLAIVKKIVDKHHGRVDVHTEVGVGSSFTVYLPLHPAHVQLN